MSELYVTPLITILLAGMIRGIYSSARQIYGYSNPFLFGDPENDSHLGLLPIAAAQAGIVMFVEIYVLLTFRPPLKDSTLIPLIAFIIGGSGMVCSGHTFLRSLSAPFMKYGGIVISSGVMSCVFGLFAGQLPRSRPNFSEGSGSWLH
jgi:hypothetical protein